MRKLSVLTNISLDGYFEAPGHDVTGFTNDFEAFSYHTGAPADTLLFGHNTYEMMKFWDTPAAQSMPPEVTRFMNDTLKVVASRSPFDPGWRNVLVIHEDVPTQVRQLKEQTGGTILIFGSNTLVVSLMQAGLIDEFQLIVNPVAFAAGTPIFKGLPAKTGFALKDAHPFKSGAVMLTYTPAS